MDKSTPSSSIPRLPSKTAIIDLAVISTAQAGIVEASVHRRLQKVFASFLQSHNLAAMEWFVIGYLHEKGNEQRVLISDIAKNLQTTMPYMTNLLHSLESKGLIEKVGREADNRTKLVKILPKAEAVYDAIENDLRSKLRSFIYGKVSQKDFLVYIRVMYSLAS
jgi:DNA-binding MarR family transcriptional regulator